MKTLILLSMMFAVNAMAAKTPAPKRNVSNSTYFVCLLERDGADKKIFKKEVHFPFPTEQGETYELKGSMRWNDYKIIFSQTGEVKIKISEMVKSERVHVEKTHQMGKDAQFESFKVQVDVKKGDLVIPYHIQCSPE